MAQEIEPFKFRHPSSIIVAGPSGSGKTVFTSELIRNNRDLWPDTPPIVHYCYGVWQPAFKELKKVGVHFHEGVPDIELFAKWFPKGGLLILDDLMEEGGNDKRVVDIFTKYSHHKGITVLYLTQNLFPPGRYARTISINAKYVVAFKNPRDQVGLRSLLLQSFPTNWKDILNLFNRVTSRPFGYMLFDFHQESDDSCCILSHVLKKEGFTHCYS